MAKAIEYSRIEWDKLGERLYETGVDHVVLYQYVDGKYTNGVAWNGVTGVTENKSGAEASPLYADNIKYLVLKSLEEYGITIESYTYPKEFEQNNGIEELATGVTIGQQTRASFAVSFRTLVGNDLEHENYGYRLHMVYNCDASPSEESNSTINDSPEAKTFSYEITSTPISMKNGKTTSCVTVDSHSCDPTKLQALEDILYGAEGVPATLPLPDEVQELFSSEATPAKVAAGSPTTPYYGKTTSELQENIVITSDAITGTSKHVESYPEWGTEGAEGGNFLALTLTAYDKDGTVSTKMEGGNSDYKEVTDGFCIYKLSDSTKAILIKTAINGKENVKRLSILGVEQAKA